MGNVVTTAIQTKDANKQNVNNIFQHTEAPVIITSTGTSTASAVIDASNDTLVRIVADGKLYYQVAVAPVATTSDWLLSNTAGEQMRVPAGYKIAVISASGTASLNVGPLR